LPAALHFPAGLDEAAFLERYWQRRPLLLRGGLPELSNPLSADELAGLACEEDVESRLVLERDGARPWEVRHGPFTEGEFASLPESHWTLLVQDADKQVAEVAAWLEAFRFIPHWRIDDIMISYAADAGSVGPHLDEYDVFLIQAEGRRRWLIDPQPALEPALLPGLDLRILKNFHPRQDHLLDAGDVLYLPPGVPHWGIAEGACMTWSVGFRAPAWRELAMAWCEYAAERRLPAERYRDLQPLPQTHSGEIHHQVFERVRARLEEGLDGASPQLFREWFGGFVTEPKAHLQVFPADDPLEPAGFRSTLSAHAGLARHPFSRMAFCAGADRTDLLFANGEVHRLPARHHALLPVLTSAPRLRSQDLLPWLEAPDCLDLLCRLYNDGHYELFD
jgi:50S ribosomal protein L16 3-hydroxylase